VNFYHIVAAMSLNFCFYRLAGKLHWLLNFGMYLEPELSTFWRNQIYC